MTTPPPEVPAPRIGFRTRTKVILAAVLIAPLVGFSLYTWSALNFSYSDGYRAGILQKFSRKGWICKTYEGEVAQSMVPGVAPTIWYFSVRQDAVASQLDSLVGKKVRLHYHEHRGVPTSCFGMTDYFVDSVAVVE